MWYWTSLARATMRGLFGARTRNSVMAQCRFRSSIVTGLATAFLLAASVQVGYAQGRGQPQDLFARLARAMEVQQYHTDRLLEIADVIGTAVGLTNDGEPAVKVFTRVSRSGGLPAVLDGVPLLAEPSGEFVAVPTGKGRGLSSPLSADANNPNFLFPRPTPIGVSTGNVNQCSAGTISARVKNGSSVYALSNNHVYALENSGKPGDLVLQPGRYEFYDPTYNSNCTINNTANYVIGTLTSFQPINFGCRLILNLFWSCDRKKDNTIDAAIALLSKDAGGNPLVGNATPSDGYGTPKSTTMAAALNLPVQKYGRTTSLSKGTVIGINATVIVGYGSGTARFVKQLIVTSATTGPVAGPGDSGSLFVTTSANSPVGLLFAANGSGSQAIANPIDLVLSRFNVTIDGQ